MSTNPHQESIQHLQKMANDIGDFFAGETDREAAIAGISNHIRSYWTPRMRQKMMAELDRGATGLNELPRAAFERLVQSPQRKPDHPPGGDAG